MTEFDVPDLCGLDNNDFSFILQFGSSYSERCHCADCNYLRRIIKAPSNGVTTELLFALPPASPLNGRECMFVACNKTSTHEVDVFDTTTRHYLCPDHARHVASTQLVISHRPLDIMVLA